MDEPVDHFSFKEMSKDLRLRDVYLSHHIRRCIL